MQSDEKASILIIDDDVALLKMTGESLRDCYAVSLAKSGEQAMRLLHKGLFPDLILLDVDMPGMNGYEFVGRLGEIGDAEDIPVIFLTGMAKADSELKGLRTGAVDYITKPFVREVLLARIQVHLETGRQRRKLRILQHSGDQMVSDPRRFERIAAPLTATERNVARLIALGYTNQEIVRELNYSYYYIKKIVSIVFSKLEVHNRHDLRRLLRESDNNQDGA